MANWAFTDLGRGYRIYEVNGERVGQQFPTDTGPIDILAISHDGTELLVVELKRGRASDSVVGQIQRYMGYVAQDLAEPTQRVRGVIIALEDRPPGPPCARGHAEHRLLPVHGPVPPAQGVTRLGAQMHRRT